MKCVGDIGCKETMHKTNAWIQGNPNLINALGVTITYTLQKEEVVVKSKKR